MLVRLRIALFVDGCFWHACPAHGTLPKANAEWWAKKLAATTARDRRNDELLQERGWRVLHVWEHDDPEAIAADLEAQWKNR